MHNFVLAASNMMIGISIRMANGNESPPCPASCGGIGKRSRHPPRMDLRPPSATSGGEGNPVTRDIGGPQRACGLHSWILGQCEAAAPAPLGTRMARTMSYVLALGESTNPHSQQSSAACPPIRCLWGQSQTPVFRGIEFGMQEAEPTIALAVKKAVTISAAAPCLFMRVLKMPNTITGKMLAAKPKANATTSATNPGGSIPNQPATTTAPTMAIRGATLPFQKYWEATLGPSRS